MLLSVSAFAIPTASAQSTELIEVTFPSIADGNVFFVGFQVENGTNFKQFAQVHKAVATFSHVFYRFDLSTIFVGSTIVSANLTLFQAAFMFFGPCPCDQMNVTAFATAVGWTEQTLSFDRWNRDTRDYTGLSGSTETLDNSTVGTFVTWNITTMVDAWVNGVRQNHGIRLGAIDNGQANLNTREVIDLSKRPALTVRLFRTVPSDPGAHPLGPFIATLGVPTELFLGVLGIVAMVLAYFGLYAAHYPERFGGARPQRGGVREFFTGRRR